MKRIENPALGRTAAEAQLGSSSTRPRGSSLVPLILSMALALAFSFSRPAYAETAYQLKLPEGMPLVKSPPIVITNSPQTWHRARK
eukprot:3870749-Amphidinium_carterae.1